MINWTVRIKNKAFWLAIVPALLLLIQQVCALFGLALDVSGLGAQLTEIINTVFLVLAILGIVTDPTTYGIGDSDQALTYVTPKVSAKG